MVKARAKIFFIVLAALMASCGKSATESRTESGPIASSGSKAVAGGTQGCAGFSAEDAAKLLGVPAAQIKASTQESYKGFWLCSYQVDGQSKGISFSVKTESGPAEAASEMEKYRENLSLAGEQLQFKERAAAAGAYSDIMGPGLGDEAVWSNINGTLTVRKGAVTVQIQSPNDKKEQINVAQAVLAKL
jgi:hypothetical protein